MDSSGKPIAPGIGASPPLERLSGSVFAYGERVGRGRVIAVAEDLNFRAYWRGSNRLFLNAAVVGPSAP